MSVINMPPLSPQETQDSSQQLKLYNNHIFKNTIKITWRMIKHLSILQLRLKTNLKTC